MSNCNRFPYPDTRLRAFSRFGLQNTIGKGYLSTYHNERTVVVHYYSYLIGVETC